MTSRPAAPRNSPFDGRPKGPDVELEIVRSSSGAGTYASPVGIDLLLVAAPWAPKHLPAHVCFRKDCPCTITARRSPYSGPGRTSRRQESTGLAVINRWREGTPA
jgi:hypothetical protein